MSEERAKLLENSKLFNFSNFFEKSKFWQKSILWERLPHLTKSAATLENNDEMKIFSVDFCFVVCLTNFMLKNLNAKQMIFLPYMK